MNFKGVIFMKKIAASILALVIVLCLLIFSYHSSQSKQSRIDSLICTSLDDSMASFSDYLSSSSQESYLFGLSSFYLFKSIYSESNYYDDSFTSVISNAYFKLLSNENPDLLEMQALLNALEVLAENPSNITGYTLLQIFVDYPNYY